MEPLESTAEARTGLRRVLAFANIDLALALVLPLGLFAAGQVSGWLTASRPLGVIEPTLVLPIGVLGYLLLVITVLRRTAREAFASFRPALGAESAEADLLGRSLAFPPRTAVVVTVAGFEGVITTGYMSSPAAAATLPADPIDAIFVWAAWIAAVAAFAGLVVLALHQLRIVTKLHALATRIDLLRPAPINSFSRLTVAMAIALMPVMLFSATEENSILQVPFIGCLIVASFVLPLRGMHGRLVREKQRLLGASTTRFEAVRARLHAAIDSGDLAQINQVQSAIGAVLTERDVIAKLPTWPWTTTVFRGFASAVVLPVVVWLVIRVLERIV